MSIHINNLTFSHDDSSLLQDLSFSIKKNQIGFVSGSSGIGKSTARPNWFRTYIKGAKFRSSIEKGVRLGFTE